MDIDIMKIANSIPMWVVCAIPVLLVVLQSVMFGVKAYKAGKKVGIEAESMKKAIRSSAVTSIGPSIVILSGMLSLLVTVGGPIGWMRLSMIGSVMFESIAAGIGTETVGVTLGTDTMTPIAFTMAVWTMILGSIGWVIFSTFSANRMAKIENKISKGNTAVMTTIASSAVIGVFTAMSANNLVQVSDSKKSGISNLTVNKSTLSCILGAGFMAIFTLIATKFNVKWLKEWSLTITIVLAMVITALV